MNETTKKVSSGCKVGFAFGGLGASFTMIIPTFISFFMTESLLVPMAFVSVMIIVIKAIDGVSDIIAGALIDKTNHPKGKARPWFLWASIPC